MRIDKESLIAGQPAIKVRELLKRGDGYCGVSLTMNILDISKRKALEVIDILKKEGYLEEKKLSDGTSSFELTIKGNALALSSAAKPLLRKTADKKLAEFMERVHQVNNEDRFLYKVDEVVLFGSYLSDKERINDIDIAISLSQKEKDPDKHMSLCKKHVKDAEENGRSFYMFLDELFWPSNEVWLFLKSHSRSISLHPIEQNKSVLDQTEVKVLYKDQED
jgi:predicted nucleotidyltransferase